MAERRGAKGVRDLGVRTRKSDQELAEPTPHAMPVWITTFQLRWADHLRRKKRPGLA
ncbi:MAG: hypothetical protein ABI334_06075 [Candidatus Dormiibacterota bacterium]